MDALILPVQVGPIPPPVVPQGGPVFQSTESPESFSQVLAKTEGRLNGGQPDVAQDSPEHDDEHSPHEVTQSIGSEEEGTEPAELEKPEPLVKHGEARIQIQLPKFPIELEVPASFASFGKDALTLTFNVGQFGEKSQPASNNQEESLSLKLGAFSTVTIGLPDQFSFRVGSGPSLSSAPLNVAAGNPQPLGVIPQSTQPVQGTLVAGALESAPVQELRTPSAEGGVLTEKLAIPSGNQKGSQALLGNDLTGSASQRPGNQVQNLIGRESLENAERPTSGTRSAHSTQSIVNSVQSASSEANVNILGHNAQSDLKNETPLPASALKRLQEAGTEFTLTNQSSDSAGGSGEEGAQQSLTSGGRSFSQSQTVPLSTQHQEPMNGVRTSFNEALSLSRPPAFEDITLRAPAPQRLQMELALSETSRLQIEVGVHNRLVSASLLTDQIMFRNLILQNQPNLESQMTQAGLELSDLRTEVNDHEKTEQERFNQQENEETLHPDDESPHDEQLEVEAVEGELESMRIHLVA